MYLHSLHHCYICFTPSVSFADSSPEGGAFSVTVTIGALPLLRLCVLLFLFTPCDATQNFVLLCYTCTQVLTSVTQA